jgi:hypothetical protein
MEPCERWDADVSKESSVPALRQGEALASFGGAAVSVSCAQDGSHSLPLGRGTPQLRGLRSNWTIATTNKVGFQDFDIFF